MRKSITGLKELTQNYILEKANEIIDTMTSLEYTEINVPTCGSHSSWDKKYHNHFEGIAEYLRNKGFTISSSVNRGVTDWTITVNQESHAA